MINPGTSPLADTSEDLAGAGLEAFLAAVQARAADLDQVPIRHRVTRITGEAVRDPAADRDGRYGWDLPIADGRVIRLLIPGVDLPLMRDDITAQAPCLYVNGTAWWWNDAVNAVAAEGLELRPSA